MNPALLISLGVCYAVVFWGLAAWRAWMPLVLICMSAPFPWDLSGTGALHFSLAEVNLLLSLPVVLVRGRRPVFGPSIWPVLLYCALALFSSVRMWHDLTIPYGNFLIQRKSGDWIVSLMQVALYLIFMVMLFATLPKHVDEYRPVLKSFLFVCVVLSGPVLVTGHFFKLQKNGVGGSLFAGFIIALEFYMAARGRRGQGYMALAALFAVALLRTLSRGAWISAIVGVLVLCTIRRQFGLLLKLGLFVVPLLAIGWVLLPEEQKEYALGFDTSRWNISQRLVSVDIAKFYIQRSPLFGCGVGLRKEYDATNLYYCTFAETGVLGLLSLSLVFVSVVWAVWKTQRGLPRDHMAFSVVAIAGALVLGQAAHGMVDHYWSRGGPTVLSWASLGMLAHVADAVRRHRRNLAAEARRPLSPAPAPAPALEGALA